MGRASSKRIKVDSTNITMTKAQLERLVRTAYATFNVQMNKSEEITIFRAWWQLLSDLSYEDTWTAFNSMAVSATFLPRPGELRRATINMLEGTDTHPDPATCWGILQAMRKATETGQFYEGERPGALVQTLESLGSSAFDMHTNGDRETFIRVYSKTVEKLEQKKYKRNTKLTVVDEDF
jgi:hypothetical protein